MYVLTHNIIIRSDPLKSTVADKIIYKTRLKLVDGLSGYTPQGLLPLYVRNTLIEHNGTTTFGDQPQEVMEVFLSSLSPLPPLFSLCISFRLKKNNNLFCLFSATNDTTTTSGEHMHIFLLKALVLIVS